MAILKKRKFGGRAERFSRVDCGAAEISDGVEIVGGDDIDHVGGVFDVVGCFDRFYCQLTFLSLLCF